MNNLSNLPPGVSPNDEHINPSDRVGYQPNLAAGEPDLRLHQVWALIEGDVANVYGGLYGPTDDPDNDEWFSWWLTLPNDLREKVMDNASSAIGYTWFNQVEDACQDYGAPQ